MLEQLRNLVEFQLLEDRKAELIRSRELAPKRITEIERDFKNIEMELLSKKAEYDNAKKMHRTLEQSIADLEVKIARSKTRMNEVKTNKEYQAILKEIEDIKKDVAEKEDGILNVLDSIDSLGSEVKELEKVVESGRKRLQEDKQALLSESAQVKERLHHLEEIQQEVRDKMDPVLLRRTEFLMLKQNGIAVAAVQNGVCQVCHMYIPPQKFIELQRDEAILQCPHCHRFIYWPGHEIYGAVQDDLKDL